MKNYIFIFFVLISHSLLAQSETRILKSASGRSNAKHDMFGWQVSHNDMFVFSCAPHEDDANKKTGAVYVFERTNNQVVFQSRLNIAGAAPFTMFGKLLAHTNDYLVVTAQKSVQTSFGKGYICVYKRSANTWQLVNIISDTVCNSSPSSIAIDGNTIVAGYSIVHSTDANGFVMVYQINPADDQITLKQKITVANLKPLDLIGHCVSIHQNALAFSSVSADGNAASSGAVWVYRFINNTWNFFSEIKHPDATNYDHFGYAITIDYPFIAIGAPRQGVLTPTGKKSGAVYVYKLTPSEYNLEAKLQADAAANDYDYFGSSIDIHQNILAIGAHSDDFAGRNTGAVYVFERYGNSWGQVNKIIGSNVNDHALFGTSISLFNGSVLCSSHLEETDTALHDHGAIYFYGNAKLPTGLWDATQTDKGISFSVFPNPMSAYADITLDGFQQIKEINVYDIKGALILTIKEEDIPKTGKVTLNGTTWKRGVYVVNVRTEQATYNKQLIKQ